MVKIIVGLIWEVGLSRAVHRVESWGNHLQYQNYEMQRVLLYCYPGDSGICGSKKCHDGKRSVFESLENDVERQKLTLIKNSP